MAGRTPVSLWLGICVGLGLFAGLVPDARASLASRVSVTGLVADFDDHYVYLDAKVERYRIKRSAVPDSVNLHPGVAATFEIPFAAFRIVPATAPIKLPTHYSPPRKRTPAEN